MNTYQFVWARDTHTFSCHHNTEPTTSTTRASSSSDSSTGPLKARQRCSLEEAAAGRRERRRGEVSLQPGEWAGRGKEDRGGRKGWREGGNQTNKPTLPKRQSHSPRRWGPRLEQRLAQVPPCSPGAEPTSARHPPPAACPARPTRRLFWQRLSGTTLRRAACGATEAHGGVSGETLKQRRPTRHSLPRAHSRGSPPRPGADSRCVKP